MRVIQRKESNRKKIHSDPHKEYCESREVHGIMESRLRAPHCIGITPYYCNRRLELTGHLRQRFALPQLILLFTIFLINRKLFGLLGSYILFCLPCVQET
jgi:hypothetical protein